MNNGLFERLLYEEESTTLDFKEEQYPFVKATDEEKSELLKDILGFANAWRRSEAYILIGVKDVRGGRGNVVGIAPADHLDDHSLQQFVNSLTNRAIRFHYEAFGFEGKQVGIIHIEEQARPLYLKKDYGKLKKGEVYVRRGSSTNPGKPADPDEIALMGAESATAATEACLAVEFANPDREQSLGNQIEWTADFCHMPEPAEIPDFDDRPAPIRLPGGQVFNIPDLSSMSLHERRNPRYFLELANFIFVQKLFREVRLVVTNTGGAAANDVRLEISVANGQGFGILDSSDVPGAPKQRESTLVPPALKGLMRRPILRHPGDVQIDKTENETKVEIDCCNLQPGRKVWTDPFFIGVGQSSKVELKGLLFAANLPQPREFSLAIKATITQTKMTVEDLLSLDEPNGEDD